jgi:hypothetical protein
VPRGIAQMIMLGLRNAKVVDGLAVNDGSGKAAWITL